MPRVSGRRVDSQALRVGAVAYDPKVVTIWEGFNAYFEKRGVKQGVRGPALPAHQRRQAAVLEFLVDGVESPDLKLSGAVGRRNLYAVAHPLSHESASNRRRGRDQTLAEVRLLGGN